MAQHAGVGELPLLRLALSASGNCGRFGGKRALQVNEQERIEVCHFVARAARIGIPIVRSY
jgi:hypothetical protein